VPFPVVCTARMSPLSPTGAGTGPVGLGRTSNGSSGGLGAGFGKRGGFGTELRFLPRCEDSLRGRCTPIRASFPITALRVSPPPSSAAMSEPERPLRNSCLANSARSSDQRGFMSPLSSLNLNLLRASHARGMVSSEIAPLRKRANVQGFVYLRLGDQQVRPFQRIAAAAPVFERFPGNLNDLPRPAFCGTCNRLPISALF
jgi:hypothetical protein